MTRSSLPDRPLAWAAAAAPSAIAEVAPIGGGITRTKWLLTLVDGSRLVLRWEDPAVWGPVGREHVRREALACQLAAGSLLPVPALVATDPDGSAAGGPANLMTWRPGHARLDPLGDDAVRSLARSLVAIHRRRPSATDPPPHHTRRGPAEPVVPAWSPRPQLWDRAIDLADGDPPATPHGLVHGDFHFGNLLWQGDEISGIVDWAETAWGPPDLDVAHLCSDVAMMHSASDVEGFRATYVREGGRLEDDPEGARYWMVRDILGFLPDPAHILPAVRISRPDLTADRVRRGLEDLLALTLR